MRKWLAAALGAALLFNTCACAASATSAAEDVTVEETPYVYHIGICTDETTDYNGYVVEGFRDALTDRLGEEAVLFVEQTASTAPSAATAVETLLQTEAELLFTYGTESLTAAADLTDRVPIVFAGVLNYEDVLHILSNDDDTTGRNVTGISSMPSIDEQLSLLIEAANHHPQAVGILYEPADTLAIVQNEVLEDYLDEAQIPWKEYELTDETASADAREPSSDDEEVIPIPSFTAAASGKEGTNIHPDALGDSGDLTGINEPRAARTARESVLWKAYAKEHMTAENDDGIENALSDAADNREADATVAAAADNTEMTDVDETAPTNETILKTACDECDTLYVCAKSRLTEMPGLMRLLSDLAAESSTVTVGGDEQVGADTLVCLYEDPYDIGYRCGQKGIDILNGESTADELTVDAPLRSKTFKLYNAPLADALDRAFPKSFHERESYLTNYAAGELTERLR